MKLFSFFQKKVSSSHLPLWSIQLLDEALTYHGEDIPDFLKKFDTIEDRVIDLWNINKLSWSDYQKKVAEVQEARQLFVRFVYN